MSNKIYGIEETSIVFGSGDEVALTSESVADGAGRQSAQKDLGVRTIASSGRFRYRAYTKAATAPTVGGHLEWWLKTSDGTHADNDDGTGDVAVSSFNKLLNLQFVDECVADEAAGGVEFVCHGTIYDLNERYIQVVMWNKLGAATSATASDTKFVLTPMPLEVQ